MEKILEVIRKQIGISDSKWPRESENHERRATKILEVLRKKKFMLMIDDIWERIDLTSMGIPLPDHQNESKVVFTSRSRDVCGLMEAQRRIKVGCLAREEAINLFQMKVGEETLKSHPEILKLAKVVAEECEGLPLALITIGRAMRSRKTPGEWEHAISELRNYPSEFSGIGDQVFPVLRFSYDSLPCERDRKCFLYCSILREGYNIRKDELIYIWIGEGLLDERRNIHEAYNLGEHVVGTLKLACLLESDESEEFVRMHDIIRDMALWIANTGGRERNKILVQHVSSTEAHKFKIPDETERVSVWGDYDNIESFIGSEPHCPNLLSLFVKDTKLITFSNGFFQYMQALKVLDLSGNRRLTKLPESIGKLINLQYLNLSETGIVELPLELEKLKKLKSLLLNYTKDLKKIPTEVISSLLCLQVFSMVSDEFSPRDIRTAFYDEQALLVELEHLDDLDDLRITICLASGVTTILESPKLQKRIKMLSFKRICDLECLTVSSSSLERMKHLVKLEIMYCKSLQKFEISRNTSSTSRHYFPCLSEVVIWGCELRHATWLIYAPHLQKLTIADCTMVNVIEETEGVFCNLQTLHLQSLFDLRIICPRALVFPALIEIHVDQCVLLRELPLNAESASGLKQIKGTAKWWNLLEWEDKAIEDTFKSKFVEIPDYK